MNATSDSSELLICVGTNPKLMGKGEKGIGRRSRSHSIRSAHQTPRSTNRLKDTVRDKRNLHNEALLKLQGALRGKFTLGWSH